MASRGPRPRERGGAVTRRERAAETPRSHVSVDVEQFREQRCPAHDFSTAAGDGQASGSSHLDVEPIDDRPDRLIAAHILTTSSPAEVGNSHGLVQGPRSGHRRRDPRCVPLWGREALDSQPVGAKLQTSLSTRR